MTELNRTGVFVAIAVVLSALTYLTMPSIEKQSPAEKVGQSLFPDFEDPLEATSLEVVKFDKETATANTFKVAKIGDSWVIPSHNNYPADAKDQLADVAAEWINLKVLGIATDPAESGGGSEGIRDLHKLYGVVDPIGEDTSDADGVGIRVVMRDKGDKELVRIIIGKEVKDQFGLRYVRIIGQDPVYTVKANTSKLSTKFEDWIEDDLLKLSSWDIRKVDIDDYSIDLLKGYITPRGQISLDHNDTGDPRWKLAADRVYSKNGWTDRGLAENEELNTDTLNDLKSSLDNLKIVDVVRKPKGLSETLRSSGSIDLDPEAEQSLTRAGFHVIPVTDPANPGQQYYELRSNEGEISASMKNGVKYVLRFGQIAGMGSSDEGAKEGKGKDEKKEKSEDAKDEAGADKKESSDSKVNRYLFVMAQMDRSMIEEPEYKELPELPADEPKKDEPKKDEPKKEEPKKEETKKEDAKPEKAKPDDAKAEKPKPDDAKPEEAKTDEAKPEETQPEKAKADDAKPEEAKKEEAKPTREEIEKQREQIQKENDRKKEEYEEKVKEGEEKVKELNARFADWYYVIDDGEYQKIHLSRDKIVREKKKEEEKDKKSDDSSEASPGPAKTEPDGIGEFESLKLDAPAEKK
ncbi:MAG: DUF4340 domain-containing protein [Planctomycetaceae bacterium]|nr:DUF4340 domain-containing protein [Planctomycetaceae bacterium]